MNYNILDKYKSISIDRISSFFDRKCIRHHCTPKQNRIDFMLDGFLWGLCMDKDYFRIELSRPIRTRDKIESPVDMVLAENVCLDVTQKIKVLKAYCTLENYIDEDKANELIKLSPLRFNVEFFCHNMYDFRKLFYIGINVIFECRRLYVARQEGIRYVF